MTLFADLDLLMTWLFTTSTLSLLYTLSRLRPAMALRAAPRWTQLSRATLGPR